MFKDIAYNEMSKEMLNQLQKGAFLTVKAKDELNTMTIGWGSVGYIWNKPIFMVAVRYSRYTYELIEKTDEFTVSLPLTKDMKKELSICGTKSKREIDKFKECNLTPKKGKVVDTPIIDQCDLHYECKIVYKQAMEPGNLDKKIKEAKYSDSDFHVLYYGEIVASYIKE
ncbi:flavin reductase family protein [Maledivibacter halophilus]|uniref:NADH-FMN oxidoreductase RutF, flavin reductase (DIM6/NTAB) family n=1 Tax=Maledivibacter halophilus TaxID=36842 RepID=A0A1T5M626_9FIRM|nr:flavin reductase family protein [Maledivibacter halophilus]SKC83682.1 NADH-FMN oxidoreductase RutF, flavin reductase (DIM6/NTAB) family [Maledivibacter halophilus]